MNLYLLPASKDNLNVSIYNSVSCEFLKRYISEDVLDRIKDKLGSQGFYCWAFTCGTVSNYNNMRENDIVLFKENQTDIFSFRGQVTDKLVCTSLGNALWPFCKEKPWEYIFFIKNLEPVALSSTLLYQELGYTRNFHLQGAKRVADTRLSGVVNRFGGVNQFFFYLENGEIEDSSKSQPVIIRRTGTKKKHGKLSSRGLKDVNQRPPSISTDEADLWKI